VEHVIAEPVVPATAPTASDAVSEHVAVKLLRLLPKLCAETPLRKAFPAQCRPKEAEAGRPELRPKNGLALPGSV
jgi:hypothetical protein